MHKLSRYFGIMVIGLMPALAHAEQTAASPLPESAIPSTFTEAQKTEIQNIVRDFLVSKEPETVIKAAQAFQAKEEATSQTKAQESIANNKDRIYNDKTSPVAGDPKGDVTIVEFFDYQCGYCKMAQAAVQDLLKSDKKIRFVFKEFPILGPDSVIASKAALASVSQGKYEALHEALMSSKEHMSEEVVLGIAKKVGLDIEKLKTEMNSDAITKIIQSNIALGGEIGARGTPTFVIADQLFPGAMQLPQMQEAVKAARLAASAKK